MTARDEMAVLYERAIIGEDPGTGRYNEALEQVISELDALVRLATDPETAPVVFRWLVEAGVLDKHPFTERPDARGGPSDVCAVCRCFRDRHSRVEAS